MPALGAFRHTVPAGSVCIRVDLRRIPLAEADLLRSVDTVVTGEQIGDRDREDEVRRRVEAEHLKRDEQRGERTVCDAAEDAGHADRGAERRVHAGKTADHMPEGRTDKERRHDLTALEATAEGHRGEQNLQQEGIKRELECRIFDAARDDIRAGTVIGLVAHEQRQHDDDHAGHRHADVVIREVLLQQLLTAVHRGREEDRDQRARPREEHRADGVAHMEGRHRGEQHRLASRVDRLRHEVCGQCRHRARYKRGVIHHADGTDLHREHRRRERRTEQRRERRTHAAHDGPPPLVLPEVQQLPEPMAEGTADLQRRTLTSGRTTEEMRQHRRHDDEWCHLHRHTLTFADGLQHEVRPPRLPRPEAMIKPDDEQTHKRQQKHDPGMRQAEARRQHDGLRKQRRHTPDQNTGQHAETDPFEPHQQLIWQRLPVRHVICPHNSPPFAPIMGSDPIKFF